MEITNDDLQQAITDALAGLALALAPQLDRGRFATDLLTLARQLGDAEHRPGAGLLAEVARVVEGAEVMRLPGAAPCRASTPTARQDQGAVLRRSPHHQQPFQHPGNAQMELPGPSSSR